MSRTRLSLFTWTAAVSVGLLMTAAGCLAPQAAGPGNTSASRANDTAAATKPAPSSPAEKLVAAPMSKIGEAIAAGMVTSEGMVRAYLERIALLDRAGPRLQAVLTLNPDAIADAQRLDVERAAGVVRGPLHGVPVLIKDNVETADPMPTTAGSLALADNLTNRDAPLVAGLRKAGAVILGKTNLSEWANFRSTASISGWSALGGQVRNPYMLSRSPCGSSSGSGAGVAAALAAAAVGTETNGSIICPASLNGIVGFKPTVKLVSQERIVPISSTQDTAGPMTRTVTDAALMLRAMVDRPDAPDYAAELRTDALEGVRIGVLKSAVGSRGDVKALFEAALAVLKDAGATLVEIEDYKRPKNVGEDEFKLLKAEFKATLNAYLADTPTTNTVRSLADLIAFNESQPAARELALFGQEILKMCEKEPDLSHPDYISARDRVLKAARKDGIDRLLKAHDVQLLISPSRGPAFLIDAVYGDHLPGSIGAGWMAAIAGYPHLSVPMGLARGLPVGLSFMATAGQDAAVLAAGFAYEQRRPAIPAPKYLPAAHALPDVGAAMARPSPVPPAPSANATETR